MIKFISVFNFIILILFFCCYFYQAVYVFIRFIKKQKDHTAETFHKFAILISARNENSVISGLLECLNNQSYPSDCYDIYVVADNCTDNTADIARSHGAFVFERFNKEQVGKGYALDYALKNIKKSKGYEFYDAYIVFDADNLLDENYLMEMNHTFDSGYDILTSYRNSKNYDSNWISAGYALWFLRESKYLNGSRMLFNTSCAISGTGFLVSSKIIAQNDGWKHHLLTEDIEFSIDNAIQGNKIGYCEKAVLYDEQPVDFHVSWLQRLRWAKGFYQVFYNYGKQLVKGCVKERKFQCFDMLMTIAPATLITLSTLLFNFFFICYGIVEQSPDIVNLAIYEVFSTLAGVYLSLFLVGAITTITEWEQIHCSSFKKIIYLFTFPIFIFTYIPIAIVALFKKVTWVPIQHTISKNVEEIRQ